MAFRVTVDLSGLKKFRGILEKDLRRRQNGPIRQALNKWGEIYSQFLYQRYITNSQGGGEWQPISEEWAKRKGHDLILIEDGHMIRDLRPSGFSKKKFRAVPFGIRITVGSDEQHPNRTQLSIGQLMQIHHRVRPIVVPPNRASKQRMIRAMNRGLKFAEQMSKRTGK